MAYLLQFPAATAYVNTGRLILGAGYSVTFDIQRDSDVNIYLSNDTGDELRYIVGAGWQIRLSNTYYTYNEPELTPPIGSRFTVTFSRSGSTSTRGVALNGGTVYTRTTVTDNLWVNNLGQGVGGVYQAFKLYKVTITNPSNTSVNRVFDPDASGGSGSLLINTLTNTNNGTLTGAGWSIPACWIFYSSGGTSWEGTVGKTSLSVVNKSLSINTGQLLSPNKVTLTLSTKQQSISTGFVATNGKTSLTLSPKQESINVGYINTLSKLGLALLQKQLSITVGANLPFTGVIGKTTYVLNGKQLGLALGWNSGVAKSTLPVSNKQESVLAGFVNTINEINIPVNGKPLNLQTGTSISYVGTINKGGLNVSGKPLNVVAGTSIPFVGLMQKTSLTLTGKQLGVVRGQVLDLQKQALNIVGKQLSLGEIVYPIIPIERVFTIKDGDRIHYFKQTTTVYVMKNN